MTRIASQKGGAVVSLGILYQGLVLCFWNYTAGKSNASTKVFHSCSHDFFFPLTKCRQQLQSDDDGLILKFDFIFKTLFWLEFLFHFFCPQSRHQNVMHFDLNLLSLALRHWFKSRTYPKNKNMKGATIFPVTCITLGRLENHPPECPTPIKK